jgi:hypothetical protein
MGTLVTLWQFAVHSLVTEKVITLTSVPYVSRYCGNWMVSTLGNDECEPMTRDCCERKQRSARYSRGQRNCLT